MRCWLSIERRAQPYSAVFAVVLGVAVKAVAVAMVQKRPRRLYYSDHAAVAPHPL